MSRIGKRPIDLPKGVTLTVNGRKVSVKGPKGTLERELHETVDLKVEGSQATVSLKDAGSYEKGRFHGLTRSLVSNMVTGVSTGFQKKLKLVGVGFRAAAQGKGVTLTLGFSHPINFEPPAGVTIKVDSQTALTVDGADKESVGQVAATLRSFRPPEPYHGKGVRYENEVIVEKVGKAAGKK